MDIYRRPNRTKNPDQSPVARDIANRPRRRLLVTQTGAISAVIPATVSDHRLSAAAVRAVRQRQYGRALKLLNQLIQQHPDQS